MGELNDITLLVKAWSERNIKLRLNTDVKSIFFFSAEKKIHIGRKECRLVCGT